MLGRMSLAAIAASAMLLVGGAAAHAADNDGIPYEKLVEVTVPNQDAVDSVTSNYDAAEYKKVQDDGSILLNVFVTGEQEKALENDGYTIGKTIEDSNTGADRMDEAQQVKDQEALAADLAQHGMKKGAQFQGKSIVPTPGDTVIQRAVIFTDAVGPNLGRTTARFLYVEAFNKSTKVTGTTTVTGPTLALSYAGHDGVYSTATNMGRFVDTDPTPDFYMYHRQLIRLPDTFTADPSTVTIRVATAATAGGAAASTESFPVTEWLGKALPAHVAGFKKDFVTHYQDPLETRNNLDALARSTRTSCRSCTLPEKSARLPAQVAGDHVRQQRHRLGAGRPARQPDPRHLG